MMKVDQEEYQERAKVKEDQRMMLKEETSSVNSVTRRILAIPRSILT